MAHELTEEQIHAINAIQTAHNIYAETLAKYSPHTPVEYHTKASAISYILAPPQEQKRTANYAAASGFYPIHNLAQPQ